MRVLKDDRDTGTRWQRREFRGRMSKGVGEGCFWVWLQISIDHCLVNGFHCGGMERLFVGDAWRDNPSDLSRINLSASRQIGIRCHARCKTQLHGPTDLLWSTVDEAGRRRPVGGCHGGGAGSDVCVCVCSHSRARAAP